jgi:hypothetical protein
MVGTAVGDLSGEWGARMKALSLWQPHPLAITLGWKPYETRSWPTSYRGRLAIHAAQRPWNTFSDWDTEARRRFCEHNKVHGWVPWSFGAVLCTADLVDCVRTSELRGRIPEEQEFWGDFSDGEDGKGRWAFKLERVQALETPLPWRGLQGFFEVELEDGVEAPPPPAPVQGNLFGGL